MLRAQTVDVGGTRLVILPERDYEALCRSAGQAAREEGLPAFPKPGRDGTMPAMQFARVSMARDIIRERRALGLSQQMLADRAGIRQETLSRIETAKHTATPATISKIERALKKEAKRKDKPANRQSPGLMA